MCQPNSGGVSPARPRTPASGHHSPPQAAPTATASRLRGNRGQGMRVCPAHAVRSHSFCALSHSSCAQNPTVFEPSCRCPLIMCETHRFHGAPRADRRRNSGIFCRVAHELCNFWLKNSGMCATVHTHTWLKNYGILQRFLLDGSFNVRFLLNDRAVFCLPQLCFWLSECDVLHWLALALRCAPTAPGARYNPCTSGRCGPHRAPHHPYQHAGDER